MFFFYRVVILIYLTLLCFLTLSLKAQPSIRVKQQPTVVALDNNGTKVIAIADLATVTSSITASPAVAISPSVLNCNDIGNQLVTITASDSEGISSVKILVKVIPYSAITFPTGTFDVPVYGDCVSATPDFAKIYKAVNSCSAKLSFSQSEYAGTYLARGMSRSVILKVTDEYGNIAADTVVIRGVDAPVPIPSLSITASSTAICSGQSLTFSAVVKRDPGFGLATVQWLVNNQPVKNATSLTFTTESLQNGDRVSCYIIGACSDVVVQSQNVIPVQVDPASVSAVHISVLNNNSCPGSEITFSTDSGANTANLQYQWQVNDQDIPETSSKFSSYVLNPGDKVTCIASDSTSACLANRRAISNFVIVNILSAAIPAVSISPLKVDVCASTPVKFTATGQNQGNNPVYQWQVNGVNTGINSPDFTYAKTSSGDRIGCILTNSQSCSPAVTSNIVPVTVFQRPAITMNNAVSITSGSGITLNPVVTGEIIRYEWTPSTDLNNSLIKNPVASPKTNTLYRLQVTSANGCQAEDSIFVKVIRQKLIIPNTFTPNGDGINDTWLIAGLTAYTDYSINIFNRYGQRVFYSSRYSRPWDGTFNGYPLPAGVYYYIIKTDSGKNTASGPLTIIR